MIFLVDHNFKGHARIILGSIASQGWLDYVSIRFVMFEEVGLQIDSNDRTVWRLAQDNQMIFQNLVTRCDWFFPFSKMCLIGDNSVTQYFQE